MTNLFRPSFGSKPERIIGRDAAVNSFVEGLQREPGHRDRARLIIGQRGMGKTALLLELADRARKMGFVVTRVTAGAEMLDDIIEGIQVEGKDVVSDKKSQVRGFSAGALGFSFGLTFSEEVRDNYGFKTKLSLLCDRLEEAGRGVLILVDEVQPNDETMRVLASAYQHLGGEGKNIAIAMAGLPASVSSVLNDKVLTFLNRARKTYLEPLSSGEVMGYYADAFGRENRRLTSNQLKRAAKATGGFPYLLQLIGYYVVELTSEGDEITDLILESALTSAMNDLRDDVFVPTLNALSRKDLEVLTAIAEESSEGVAVVTNLLQRLKVSNSYFQQYRARLLAADVIEAPRDGEVSITMPFLADHLLGKL